MVDGADGKSILSAVRAVEAVLKGRHALVPIQLRREVEVGARDPLRSRGAVELTHAQVSIFSSQF